MSYSEDENSDEEELVKITGNLKVGETLEESS